MTATTDHRAHGLHGRRFSIDQVIEIRNLRTNGKTVEELAGSYGVSTEVISRMCRGVSYREFPGPITRREDVGSSNTFPGTRNNCRRVSPHCISDEKRDEIMRDFRTWQGGVGQFCDKHGISNTAFKNILADFESLEFVRMVKREAKRSRDMLPADKVRQLLGPGGKYYKVKQ